MAHVDTRLTSRGSQRVKRQRTTIHGVPCIHLPFGALDSNTYELTNYPFRVSVERLWPHSFEPQRYASISHSVTDFECVRCSFRPPWIFSTSLWQRFRAPSPASSFKELVRRRLAFCFQSTPCPLSCHRQVWPRQFAFSSPYWEHITQGLVPVRFDVQEYRNVFAGKPQI